VIDFIGEAAPTDWAFFHLLARKTVAGDRGSSWLALGRQV